jgi:hypothetical protein
MSMSKLTRALVVGTTLAAMNLAGLAAVAHANDQAAVAQDGRRPPTERQVGEPYHHRQGAPQQQVTADATRRAALAQECYYSTWGYGDPAVQQALAQECYYSTWGYGHTPIPAPAKPSGRPDWLVPGLGALAAAVALATGLAVLAAKRARRRVRAGQAA